MNILFKIHTLVVFYERFLNFAPPIKSYWLVESSNSSECIILSETLERRIMLLAPFKIFILMCGFCSRFHAIEYPRNKTAQTEVQRGVDVSLRCEVSFLSESSTLQWEKDGQQTSNTTLLYNNSAYIILHTVDKHNEGKYYCRLMENGTVKTVRNYLLTVSSNSYNKNNTIYRQSSNNSDVSLICKSSRKYESWKWTWEPRPDSQIIDLIAVEKGSEVQVKGPIKPGRLSSTTYNDQLFTFHISPVNFNHSGAYRCITNDQKIPYTTTMLHTIRVSVEPPDGVLRTQSVILTCEVSEVTDSVTLVWLRMEGNRGVLEKQQIMTENKLQLTVNLSSYETDPLHWQCAVFTENELRALAPITISLSSSTTNAPKDIMTQDSHLQMVIIMACAVTGGVLILLLGLLVFKRQRKTGADSWFKISHASSEVSYETPSLINISECHFDLLMIHDLFVIYSKSTLFKLVYLNIYRICWTAVLQSSIQLVQLSEP
ncbi:uncharacterized protein LOC125270273 isoform X2 [Megalobrama amblycephala]|uniref:uncharacterized protein LOC125270273 isoform X2 n=1 Tax=Megalobrama amblycephala TaxID=75352 RepID=UPI0020142979|nr:uncharacterized protein LOC125270273 isoform X2 [Megalobrama amblycephala]